MVVERDGRAPLVRVVEIEDGDGRAHLREDGDDPGRLSSIASPSGLRRNVEAAPLGAEWVERRGIELLESTASDSR